MDAFSFNELLMFVLDSHCDDNFCTVNYNSQAFSFQRIENFDHTPRS